MRKILLTAVVGAYLLSAGNSDAQNSAGPAEWSQLSAIGIGTNFTTSYGKIIAPNGSVFVPNGIDVADWATFNAFNGTALSTGNGLGIIQLFPGTNMVRIVMQSEAGLTQTDGNDDPAQFATFIANMTAAHIVVVICDYNNYGSGAAPSGAALTTQEAWFVLWANAYPNHPYVWFESSNEMASGAITAEHTGVYGALRGAGYKGPIIHQPPGGVAPVWTGTTFGGTSFYNGNTLTASAYNTETNIIWDTHYYGWIPSNSTAYATVFSDLMISYRALQNFTTSANGTIPVFVGEYGNSAAGVTDDVNGTQTVMAVQGSGLGSTAWTWSAGTGADYFFAGTFPAMSTYGQEVAAFIAGAPTTTTALGTSLYGTLGP